MKYLSLIIIIFSLSGCPALFIGGAVAGVGANVATQERKATVIADDLAIKKDINDTFNDAKINDIYVDLYEGRVLLTGVIANKYDAAEAVRLAWLVAGVREVIDEIVIADARHHNTIIGDKLLEMRVKSRLSVNKGINSRNYIIRSIDGSLYILGLAYSKEEIRKATGIIKYINGVNRVISHLRLVNDPRRTLVKSGI